MTNPHVLDQLPLWVEGDLDGTEMIEVAHHLAQCPACLVVAERLQISQTWLREAMDSPFEAADRDRLRRTVMDQVRAGAKTRPIPHFALRPALLAACAASLLVTALIWQQDRGVEAQSTPFVPVPPPRAMEHASQVPPQPHPMAPATQSRARSTPGPASAAASPSPPTRIEFQTADPTIRIIWLAQTTSLSSTNPSLEEKS